MKTTKSDSPAKIRMFLALLVCSALCARELPAQFRSITIHANGNVKMLVVDPQGRQMGYDFTKKKYYEEIPGGNIGAAGIDIVTDEGGEKDSSQANPIDAMIPEAVDGDYEITLTGGRLGFYDLNVLARHLTKPITNIADGGIIDSAETATFQFTYDFNDRSKSIIRKVVETSTLRQDLDNSHAFKLLGDKELHKDLAHRLDKFENYLADKDSAKARHELEKFGEKIEDVRNQTIKAEQKKQKPPKHFITADAYQILQEDVNALLKQLPEEKKEKKEKEGKDGDKDEDREGRGRGE